ncbi:MAG: hypothetical protein ACT4QE_24320 [Anaerolineales bacterium]
MLIIRDPIGIAGYGLPVIIPLMLKRGLQSLLRQVSRTLWIALCVLALRTDVYAPATLAERVLGYTSGIAFDFVAWTVRAAADKVQHTSVDEQLYLSDAARSERVRALFELRARLSQVESEIAERYADPSILDPALATTDLRALQVSLRAKYAELQPLAEAILQEQVAVIWAEQGLAFGGQPFPPPAFHLTPLPLALIISPRTEIRQIAVQMVNGDLKLEQQVALETRVAEALDVSTFVTPVGGIGTYPAMVAPSSDLNWIASVTAHEWAHNYLTLRPLGLLYDARPELRAMNETAAQLVGDEVGASLMRRYYPDIAPSPPGFSNFIDRTLSPEEEQTGRPGFDYRAEMRRTRVRVDELLTQGKVDEAEAYMEQRRAVFWENGYRLRKLNQAFFAFYGAYDGAPGGGAAGADPVGPAVRLLRRRSPNAAEFLQTIAWFTSLEQLRAYLSLPAQP